MQRLFAIFTVECNESSMEGEAGFSLLEILVAIALIALAVSTAMVNVQNMIQRSENKAFKENVILMVRDARYAAVTHQVHVNIADHAVRFFETLKTNVQMEPIFIQSDVVVQKSGMCASGLIVAEQKKRRLVYEIAAFGCELRLVPAS